MVRGMRNTEPASGSSEASALVFEIETDDGNDLEIASSQWIYRTCLLYTSDAADDDYTV